MSVQACAEMVRKGDEDRFLSAMTGDVAAREVLFPIYAFNLEVARAPWVSQEPLIAEMRLQFWRDTLAEAGEGKARAHEVAGPLAGVIASAGGASALLTDVVNARRADVAREPFATQAALMDYLDQSAGALMWASMSALGAPEAMQDQGRALGRAAGLASWLLAVPSVAAHGWQAWPSGDYAALIETALADLRALKGARFGTATPAARAAWRAPSILKRAKAAPEAIGTPALEGSEFARRGGLLWRSVIGSW